MEKQEKIKSLETSQIENFSGLGGEIKISPKSNVNINKAGYKKEFFVKTISICIGIGKDNTADLIMDFSAWKALMEGQKVHITTTKEHEKMYGKRKIQKMGILHHD